MRGPKPLSAHELARRGSWRAKARRKQEAALRVVADDPLDADPDAVRRLTERLLAVVNAADHDMPAGHAERTAIVAAAADWLGALARDPLAWEESADSA